MKTAITCFKVSCSKTHFQMCCPDVFKADLMQKITNRFCKENDDWLAAAVAAAVVAAAPATIGLLRDFSIGAQQYKTLFLMKYFFCSKYFLSQSQVAFLEAISSGQNSWFRQKQVTILIFVVFFIHT